MGQVVRPTLKSDAENAVKRIEGVESVDNKIEVLPTSPMDDGLRFDAVPRHLRLRAAREIRARRAEAHPYHREERSALPWRVSSTAKPTRTWSPFAPTASPESFR